MAVSHKFQHIIEAGHKGAQSDTWLVGAIACSVLGPFAALIVFRYFGVGLFTVATFTLIIVAVGCLSMFRRTRREMNNLYDRTAR